MTDDDAGERAMAEAALATTKAQGCTCNPEIEVVKKPPPEGSLWPAYRATVVHESACVLLRRLNAR